MRISDWSSDVCSSDLGLRVALDDFGTGYASLTHLLTVPVDIIKIDKSFVARLAPGDASMAIVEGLLQIARDLEIRVIAEGIETARSDERRVGKEWLSQFRPRWSPYQ